MSPTAKPLSGWRILVPRGGKWGDAVAATLRTFGATPVIAPMINFASTDNESALAEAMARLEAGSFDWIVITSATTVDVLMTQGTNIPAGTKVAAVGETTAAALLLAGYRVDFVPEADNSARGLIRDWPESASPQRVLIPHSDVAEPTIVAGLATLGLDVEYVAAYRTVGVPIAESVRAAVEKGDVQAILVTSGSVARQIAEQLAPVPEKTVLASIGPRTAFDAREVGLTVHAIAEFRSADSLIDALVEYARGL